MNASFLCGFRLRSGQCRRKPQSSANESHKQCRRNSEVTLEGLTEGSEGGKVQLNYINLSLPLSSFLPIDFKASLLGGSLATKTEMFVVCHELAHHILGHLETSRRKSILVRNVQVEVPVSDWTQEFEADALGLKLLLNQIRDPYDLSMTYAGIDFFFQIMILLEDFTQFQGSDTHPPASLRLKKIRDYAALHCPDEANRKILFKMANELEFLVAEVWNTFKSWTEEGGNKESS